MKLLLSPSCIFEDDSDEGDESDDGDDFDNSDDCDDEDDSDDGDYEKRAMQCILKFLPSLSYVCEYGGGEDDHIY